MFSEGRWIDWPLSKSILKLASSPRAVSTEMICDESVDVGHIRRHVTDRVDPRIHFAASIDLNAREIDEIAIGAHPPDVRKISRRAASQGKHHFARNPAAIDKRETDISVAKERDYSLGKPAAVPELDCETEVGRKLADKIHQRRQLVRLEIRTELNENWSKLLLELAGSLIKLFADAE